MVCSLMIDQAEIACGNSDYTRAVALLTSVVDLDPKNIVAYVKRAMAVSLSLSTGLQYFSY